MPLFIFPTSAARRRAKSDQRAWVSPSGISRARQSGAMPAAAPNAPHKLGSDRQGRISLLMHTLFGLVALLLIADLHSSYLAGSAKWETNPFMTILAERVGPRIALLAIKTADFMCLAGMYALWRRSRAHIVIGVALSTAALVYVDIVLNNYSR